MKQLLFSYQSQKNKYVFILVSAFIYVSLVFGLLKRDSGGADSRGGSSVAYTVPVKVYNSGISQGSIGQKAQNNGNGPLSVAQNAMVLNPVIYAKIYTYESTLTPTDAYYDVYVRFYSDAACTQPYSVTGLNYNYKATKRDCPGYELESSIYSANCTGSEVFLGTLIWSRESDEECWYYEYDSAPGTGYVPK